VAARPDQGSRQDNQRRLGEAPVPDQENFYQLLSVPASASSAEITRSYREAMKRFHPDRVRPEYRRAAEDLCKDLNRAYKTLSNPADRLAYDRSIRGSQVRDQIMQRYTGEFGGPRAGFQDVHGTRLKRELTEAERREHRRGERSAFVSLVSVFLVVTLGAIGLILIGGLVSFLVRLIL